LRTTQLSTNQPNLCDKNSYSGYFTADANHKYFYWFFEARTSPTTAPLILWLTGGPGCSSMLALLVENGPCYVNDQASDTFLSETSWTEAANVVWVDQPPGTGFSTGSVDTTEDEIAEDMYAFLLNFMEVFPQYFNNDFFVFGESYAGHYVPAITSYIFDQNQNANNKYIPLKAFAIGNGLTDPYIQYAYYAIMAYNSTTAPSVIDEQKYNVMVQHIPQCQADIQQCNTQGTDNVCNTAENYCNTYEIEPVTSTGVNPYDLRIPCGPSNLCYNFTNVDVWLNNATVQKALGVTIPWNSCNNAPHLALTSDWVKDYQQKIPPMLAGGIRGLIYAGDQDFICNWIGNKNWALQLQWAHQTQFDDAPDKPWNPDGTVRGMIRSAYNFTFLQVYQAGHMVPMDQPISALDMVKAYVTDTLM